MNTSAGEVSVQTGVFHTVLRCLCSQGNACFIHASDAMQRSTALCGYVDEKLSTWPRTARHQRLVRNSAGRASVKPQISHAVLETLRNPREFGLDRVSIPLSTCNYPRQKTVRVLIVYFGYMSDRSTKLCAVNSTGVPNQIGKLIRPRSMEFCPVTRLLS